MTQTINKKVAEKLQMGYNPDLDRIVSSEDVIDEKTGYTLNLNSPDDVFMKITDDSVLFEVMTEFGSLEPIEETSTKKKSGDNDAWVGFLGIIEEAKQQVV